MPISMTPFEQEACMAAAATVSREDIRSAGEALRAGGRGVSGYSLRMQLGNKGDAKRLLAVWEDLQQATPADPSPAAKVAALPPELAAQAVALAEQVTAQLQAVITAAWTAAERRAHERLSEEVAAAQSAAAAARQAQAEADAVLIATDAALAAVTAERDNLTTLAAKTASAVARAAGERDALRTELVSAKAALASAGRRAAAAEAGREAALEAERNTRQDAREATAAATAAREQAAADVATARAETAAARDLAEAANRIEPHAEGRKADRRRRPASADQPVRIATADPVRPEHSQEAGEADAATLVTSQHEAVPKPADGAQPEALPMVPDRLRIPKAERSAYDDGLAAGRLGWPDKPSRRFQPGQRLGHLLPCFRAGYRDGVVSGQADKAAADTATREPPQAG
jgi:Plasmid replication region DNA-binding N-term